MPAYALFLDSVLQVQDLIFVLVVSHKGPVSPLFQTIQVLVLSDSLFTSVYCPAQLNDISKLHQGSLSPFPDNLLRYGTALAPILISGLHLWQNVILKRSYLQLLLWMPLDRQIPTCLGHNVSVSLQESVGN